MNILVVAPTAREARAAGPGTAVIGTGEGAAAALRERLALQKPELVVIAGYCGGLDPSLASGDLILGRAVRAPHREEILPPEHLVDAVRRAFRSRELDFVSSRFVTVDRPAATRRDKTRLWNVFGAGGVDMETYALAAAARKYGVPWIALRAVVDPAGRTLPRSLRRWRGERDEGAILRRAALSPFEWPAYTRLALDARRAGRTLGEGVAVAREAAATAPVEMLPLVNA